MKRLFSTEMKELTGISTFKLQSHFLCSSLLLAGLLALLPGWRNDKAEVGLPAFRNYLPNVSQEASIVEAV
jgi:hypothetical protein